MIIVVSARRSWRTSGAIRQIPRCRSAWGKLIPHRQTWAFMLAKFLTDPIWWLYLFWMPDFFNRNYGIDLKTIGPPLVVIYLVADIGSIGGGWLSSTLIKRGWTVNAGRKIAMLICALAVVPMVFASGARNMWVAVALISIAAAAHQGWSANLFTTASDMFPRKAVGSVVGPGRDGRRRRRDADRQADRLHPAGHGELPSCLPDRGVHVPGRVAGDPATGPATGTSGSRVTVSAMFRAMRTAHGCNEKSMVASSTTGS